MDSLSSKLESQATDSGKVRNMIAVFSLCMTLFLAALDVTIVTTALPTISGVLHASSQGYTWIASSYLLANAASTSIWGKASDIWGRKPVLMLANVVFMIGSLIAGLSRSVGLLIGARVIQGLGGGGIVILVNICIGDLFSMRDRGKYYGFLGLTWAVAAGVGPIFGGIFTETIGWRWCFFINLPIAGLSLALLFFFLQLETPHTPLISGIKAVDWLGVITIMGGVIAFLYGLETAGSSPADSWDSALVLCLIIFGIIIIGLFLVTEWKIAKYPLMPLRIFKNRSNVAAFGVCFFHGIAYIGQVYYLPLYFQTVLGAKPILSGVYIFALVIPMSITSTGTGVYVKRTGDYLKPMYLATFCLCLGTGLFINLPANKVWSKIIIYQIIAGIGVGPLFQSPLIALQSHLKEHDIAVGTSTFEFVRNLSTSIGLVIGGVIFSAQLDKKQGALRAALGSDLAAQFASSSVGSTIEQLRSLPPQQRNAINNAYISSFQCSWIFYTVTAGITIVLALVITDTKLSTQNEMAKTGIEEQERVRLEELEGK